VLADSKSARDAINKLLLLIDDPALREEVQIAIDAKDGATHVVQSVEGELERLDGKKATTVIETRRREIFETIRSWAWGSKPTPKGAGGITRSGRVTGAGGRDSVLALIKPGEDVV